MLSRLGDTLSPRKLHKKVKDAYQQQTTSSPKQRPVIGSPTNFQHNSHVNTSAPNSPFAAGAASSPNNPLSPRRKRAPPVPPLPRGSSSRCLNLASITLPTSTNNGEANSKTNTVTNNAYTPVVRTRLQNQVWLKAAALNKSVARQPWKHYTATLQPDKNTITFVGIDEATMTRTALVSKSSRLEMSDDDSHEGHEYVVTLQDCTKSTSCFRIAFTDGNALMLWTAEIESIIDGSATIANDANIATIASAVAAAATASAQQDQIPADDDHDDPPMSQEEAARAAEEDEFEALWETHLSPPPPQLPPKPTAARDTLSPPPPPLPAKRYTNNAEAAAAADELAEEALPLPPPEDSPKASACIFDLLDKSPSCNLSSSLDLDDDDDAGDGGDGKERGALHDVVVVEQGAQVGREMLEAQENPGTESLYAVSTKCLKGKKAAAKESRDSDGDIPLAEMSDANVRTECQQLRLALQLSRGKAASLEFQVNELTLQLAAQAAIIAVQQQPSRSGAYNSAVVRRTSFSAKLAPPLPLRDGKPNKTTRKL